jgi:hypothetical protein
MRIWFLAVAFAACSSAPARPPGPPPATTSKCAFVADHLLSLLTDEAKAAPTEVLDKVRMRFETRCKDDGWSVTAQDCFLGLASKNEVDKCASQLTEDQQKALEEPESKEPPRMRATPESPESPESQ